MQMKVLVTGGVGFVGFHVPQYYWKKGCVLFSDGARVLVRRK